MVEANEAVSRLLTANGVPHLRRTHDQPRHLAAGTLRQFLAAVGHVLPANADRFALQTLLDEVRGKSGSFAVHLAVLRSMQQAEYSPARIGHYALASEDYCHFTSPIRRYPDLTIHRLIDAYLKGVFTRHSGRAEVPSERELAEFGSLCSANEQRAEAAERELKLVLVLRLLDKHVGDELAGIVTGVANVGVFVQLERFLVDGLLRFEHLIDDWWEVDPTRGCVTGQRSGHRITVGERLKVTVAGIHMPTRQLNLALAEPLKGTRGACRRPTAPAMQAARRRPATKPSGKRPRRRAKHRRSAGRQ
jgi:ribonuclease R